MDRNSNQQTDFIGIRGESGLEEIAGDLVKYKIIYPIKHAITSAEEGTFTTALSDVITNAIEVVQQQLDKELEEEMQSQTR